MEVNASWTYLLPRSAPPLEPGQSQNWGTQRIIGAGMGGNALSSGDHRFRAPTSATDAFPEARRMVDSKRRICQCAHGHQLKHRISTAITHRNREVKGIRSWEVATQKSSRELGAPEGQGDKLLQYTRPTTTNSGFPRCHSWEGGHIMAVFLPIVFCMAESGIGISRKTPRTKHLREGRTWPRLFTSVMYARGSEQKKHTSRHPPIRHRQQEHG